MYHSILPLDKFWMYARIVRQLKTTNKFKFMKQKIAKQANLSNAGKALSKEENFLDLAERLLEDLSERSRQIVKKRFGFFGERGETLENIGREYGITRERVRQILSEALKSISSKSAHNDFVKAEERIIFTINKNGGIIKQDEVVEKFDIKPASNEEGKRQKQEANVIRFFAEVSEKIFEVEDKSALEKSWVMENSLKECVLEAISEAERIIEKKKRPLEDEEIFSNLISAISGLSREKAQSFLGTARRIKKNQFGKWGMIHWMEIRPKGTREKAHLILKEHKKPLHFTEIAALIDKFKLSKRKAHPQTVHNELIKDESFVLIGRGIYALKDWGYSKGTIKDVIENILRAAGRPMKKEKIIEEVLRVRKVKKTTIMINLNNRKYFDKKGEAYSVKK